MPTALRFSLYTCRAAPSALRDHYRAHATPLELAKRRHCLRCAPRGTLDIFYLFARHSLSAVCGVVGTLRRIVMRTCRGYCVSDEFPR
jgi:hypothetical protein